MAGWPAFRRRLYAAALAIELAAIGASAASAQMYSDAVLRAKLDRIRTNLIATVEIDIPKLVDQPDRARLQTLKADLRLRGRKPLDLYFDGNRIVVPIETLKFIDDLATLMAWLDKHECDSDLLFPNYLNLTKVTPPKDRKDPLTAFGLRGAELLRDPFIDDVSLKYYNSSAWFLIAHEIGHVAQGYQSLPGKAAIAQEQRADAFATKVLRQGRLNPAGIYLYFLATSFDETLDGARAHPASAERIRAVAAELRRNPGDFVALKSKTPARDTEAILRIADSVDRIAKLLNNIQEVRKKLEKEGGSGKLASVDAQVFPRVDFTRACPRGRKG